ncbi:MAG: DEAD/DEAH box helicase [Ruminococcus bicirculans (ex Wegman et al. 2014)]
MSTIKRIELINAINEYVLDNKTEPVVDILNRLLDNEVIKKDNLDLIFMGIATTQMYGFLSYLSKEEQLMFFSCDYFRSNSYRGVAIPFYNSGQLSFLYELEKIKKVFFSAPTSFGKTSIVTEYILSNYKTLNNIAFVVPTNSLLEELYDKFLFYNTKLDLDYSISTQPLQQINGRSILMLTPERFMSVAESHLINSFDLIVMDETYKIVEANNGMISDFVNHRSLRFRKVADLIAAANTKTIFLSPFTYTLTESMKEFLSKNNIVKIDRKLEYVRREIIRMDSSDDTKKFFGEKIMYYRKSATIPEKVNLIVGKLQQDSSIVYVPNYSMAYTVATSISSPCLNKPNDSRYLAFLQHIKDNYLIDERESWSVFQALKNGIGIYISPIPRYIKKEIIKLYERKVISLLVVTSAFTEGVNTCASNLIFTSLINGPNTNRLSDIDVLNVAGRAGRFAKNTTGRIFCINEAIYSRVKALQDAHDIKLENYNYKKLPQRLDYEIEMINDEYLDDTQISRKQSLHKEMAALGLSYSDLNISLNVSNSWKIMLYKHFLDMEEKDVALINQKINDICDDGNRINAMTVIFQDLDRAFKMNNINVFPHEPYEIHPFDRSGKFTWGRFYQFYVSGKPKRIISNNMSFIQSRFNAITNGQPYSNKAQIESLFAANKASWILKYYNKDLSLNLNAFYAETFKIISNIIQYKTPYYLTFYISIFRLFLKKNPHTDIKPDDYDINKIINIFEDGDSDDEYSQLLDYGIPITTVNKLSENKISIENIKQGDYDKSKLDTYEAIILDEAAALI